MELEFPPIRILLIEDDKNDYAIIRNLLKNLCASGSKLSWMSDCDSALNAIGSGEFDVCLLDYRLGSRDGLQLLKEAMESGCRTPIIFLTGQGDYRLDLEAMKAGAADYISKEHLSSILLERSIRYAVEVRKKHEDRERKHTEEILRRSESRFRILFDAATEGIVLTDARSGEILDCNQAFSKLSGYEEHELTGKSQSFLDPDEEGNQAVAARIRGENQGAVTVRFRTKSGVVRYVEVKAGLVEIDGVEVEQKFFRDVSAELRYQEEREATLSVLRLLNNREDSGELIKELTAFLQKWTGCEAVGVRLREGEDFPYFETRGFPPGFVRAESSLCARDPNDRIVRDTEGDAVLECMCGNVIRGRFDPKFPFFTEKGSFWTNSTTALLAATGEDDRQSRTRNRCNGEGYESVGLFPLRCGADTLGLLQVNDRAKNRFTPELIAFLERLADQIAIALAQRRAQKALRISEGKLRSIVRAAPVGIGMTIDRTFLEANDHLCKITGYDRKELINAPGRMLFDSQQEYDRVGSEKNRQISEKGAATIEAIWKRKDGKLIDVLLGATPIIVSDPSAGMTLTALDITERKAAENALRESEEQFRALVKGAPDAIFIQSGGRFEYLNDAALRLYGAKSEEELLGQPLVDRVHPDYREAVSERMRRINEERRSCPIAEQRHVKLDGATIYLEINAVPINYHNHNAGLTFLRDITERKRAEVERERLQAQLLQARKMESVGRLAGGVAHDFNNMLGVVIGYAEMALDTIDPADPLYINLREILYAANRSADLTRQLLAFARKQTVSPRVLNLNDTVDGMLKMIRRLIGENIELIWKPGEHLWNVLVDPAQIDQILANLCVNARDAITGVGTVTIETGNVLSDEPYCREHIGALPGQFVRLAVGDSGYGMEKGVLDKLFEPFFTTKGVGKGTGLGLATVYGIVKQNSGFIDVHSEPGQGTTFCIYLPRNDAPAGEDQALTRQEKDLKGTETILLVEDEAAILQLGKVILERGGYNVLAAPSPSRALDLAGNYPGRIDLLITDIIMPGMNGKELAEKLGAFRSGFRSIFISGYSNDIIAQQGILEEGVHFLQKPFSVANLTSKVREVLDG